MQIVFIYFLEIKKISLSASAVKIQVFSLINPRSDKYRRIRDDSKSSFIYFRLLPGNIFNFRQIHDLLLFILVYNIHGNSATQNNSADFRVEFCHHPCQLRKEHFLAVFGLILARSFQQYRAQDDDVTYVQTPILCVFPDYKLIAPTLFVLLYQAED